MQRSQTNATVEQQVNAAMRALASSKAQLQAVTSGVSARAAPSGETSTRKRRGARGADRDGDRSARGKGLRHFSMKVCEKVESKARTTYNEVADDLVNELATSEIALEGFQFDEKNIRRRVYDAINVLMAMDIIRKEKKEIIWQGFPASSGTNIDRLKADRTNRMREVEAKQEALQVR